MNEAQSLEALGNIYNEIAEKPYDISLHIKHVNLAQSMEGMDAELQAALEMMAEFLAAGDEVWLPLIRTKEKSVDLDTAEGVKELLNLYTRAESDYLCEYILISQRPMHERPLAIPLLQKHLQYLIDRHAQYMGEEPKPATLGELFSTDWTRQAIDEVVDKGINHLAQVSVEFPIAITCFFTPL